MHISELPNPYDYANAVADPRLFAGRFKELDHLAYVLSQLTPQRPVEYVAVHGQRSAGKTSLLNILDHMARDKGFLTVRIDLGPTDRGVRDFFAKFYDELVSAAADDGLTGSDGMPISARLMRRIAAGTVRDETFALEFPESLAQAAAGGRVSEVALRADLDYIRSRLDRPIVVLIDEAQFIADSEDVLSMLRTLGMRLRGYAFVLAGTSDLLDRVHLVFDQLLRQFSFLEVARFTEPDEVQSCMARPLQTVGLEPEMCFTNLGGAADDLFHLTDGNPYEIQFYCHTMFARWQAGKEQSLTLSVDALDELRSMMERGREGHQHPVVTAIKEMTLEQVTALNILCSALGRATVDDVWFAHVAAGTPAMSREELDGHLRSFLADGTIEREDGRIQLNADLSDQIYARLWTMKKLVTDRIPHSHPQFMNSLTLTYLLSRNLQYFLCELSSTSSFSVLRTCCPVMAPAQLAEARTQLAELDPAADAGYAIEYLYCAHLDLGAPDALDLTTVTCDYRDITVTRWIISAPGDDYDLAHHPDFLASASRISALGGTLRAHRERLAMKPWRDMHAWAVLRAGAGERPQLAHAHDNAGGRSYAAAAHGEAMDHFAASFALHPSWQSANNLCYLALSAKKNDDAVHWSRQAIELATNPMEGMLSRYNAAMALLGSDLDAAAGLLRDAGSLDPNPGISDLQCSFLFVPRLKGRRVELHEVTDVSLSEALTDATELVEVAAGLARLQAPAAQRRTTP